MSLVWCAPAMTSDGGDAATIIDLAATRAGTGAADRPEPTIEERFGEAVLRLRLFWGWSQRELQHRSRVHQSQISRLESGRQRGLSTRRLFAILRALRVGHISFEPPVSRVSPTDLDVLLWGDPWERAGRAVERRRLNRRRSA
jgi:transcriptional regulator with XRE-family HTH domain